MIGGNNNQPPYPGAPPPQPIGAGHQVGHPVGPWYSAGMAYPPPIQPPARPQRPWPFRAVNRWISIAVVAITLLAVLLAVLAPQAADRPPSTAGLQPLYQSSLTSNDGSWENNNACKFIADGLLITASDANTGQPCGLTKDVPHDLLLKVRLVGSDQSAAIEFLSGYVLEIFGSGRFQVSRLDSNGQAIPLVPRAAGIGAGSIALHPSTLGTSTRANNLVILVQGNVYSFYANGQLLTRYTSSSTTSAGPIRLFAVGGQALFTDLAIYPAP